MRQPKIIRANDPKVDELIEEGCRRLRLQKKPNYTGVVAQIFEETEIHIPYHTLRNRFLGKTTSYKTAHARQQLLSPAAERVLVDWIIFYASTANPLSKRAIRKKAEAICGRKPGRCWTQAFLKRWPDVVLGKPSGLDPKRAQAFNRPVVEHFFALLDGIVKKYDIPRENVYNMDEKGCQRGGGRKASSRKYFVPRTRRPKYRHRSANLELVTIIECVCADGTALWPGFVFSGKEFCPEWFDVDEAICISLSDNGWTDDFLCTEWFTKSFIPQAKARNTSKKPILLILDGHGSHEKITIIDLAISHGIIIICLPPHTTHMLQALDVGVFGPFSRAYADKCDDIVELTGAEVLREDFVKFYMSVRQQTFKASTIRSAFKKSGTWPVNPSIFTDEDFAPSASTSTTWGHVPETFPTSTAGEHEPEDFYVTDDEEEMQDEPLPPLEGEDGTRSEDEDEGMSGDEDDEDEMATHSDNPPTSSMPATREAATAVIQDPFNLLGSDGPSSLVIPPSRFYASPPSKPSKQSQPTPIGSRLTTRATSSSGTMADRLKMLEEYNQQLEEALQEKDAHCALAKDEIEGLKRQISSRNDKGPKRQKLNVNARCLTSAEGRQLAQESEAAKAAKVQKQSQARQQRQDQERAREEQRAEADRNPEFAFSGPLSLSRGKQDLVDITHGLKLEKVGTKQEIFDRITAYFNSNPEKRDEPKYAALFNRSSRQRRTNNENTAPSQPVHPTPPIQPRETLQSRVFASPLQVAPHPHNARDHYQYPPFHPIPGPSNFINNEQRPFYPTFYPSYPYNPAFEPPIHSGTSNQTATYQGGQAI